MIPYAFFRDTKCTVGWSCFISCTLTEVGQSADCKMMVSAVGESSQWGKIRANLVSEPVETPLQVKLDNMAKLIG